MCEQAEAGAEVGQQEVERELVSGHQGPRQGHHVEDDQAGGDDDALADLNGAIPLGMEVRPTSSPLMPASMLMALVQKTASMPM